MPTRLLITFLATAAFALGYPAMPSAAPPVPELTAHETAWSEYIAETWRTSDTETRTEHTLPDGSRVDIYEVTHAPGLIYSNAWEVDRPYRWQSAIGQAAFYQAMTAADQGGVILLCLDGAEDNVYVLRCAIACRRCGLRLLLVRPSGAITHFPLDTQQPLGRLLIDAKRKG